MANVTRVNELRAQRKSSGADVSGRHKRAQFTLPLFASLVTFGFLAVTLAPPTNTAPAYAVTAPASDGDVQSIEVKGTFTALAARDAFAVTEPVVVVAAPVISAAPAAGTPDPGSAQAIAHSMLQSQGLGEAEYSCLVSLWDRESGWNVYAANPSGAYGIPQALPGSKMASAGADWETNPATQISWGLGYISSRYSTPCGAWAHSEEAGWY